MPGPPRSNYVEAGTEILRTAVARMAVLGCTWVEIMTVLENHGPGPGDEWVTDIIVQVRKEQRVRSQHQANRKGSTNLRRGPRKHGRRGT